MHLKWRRHGNDYIYTRYDPDLSHVQLGCDLANSSKGSEYIIPHLTKRPNVLLKPMRYMYTA